MIESGSYVRVELPELVRCYGDYAQVTLVLPDDRFIVSFFPRQEGHRPYRTTMRGENFRTIPPLVVLALAALEDGEVWNTRRAG